MNKDVFFYVIELLKLIVNVKTILLIQMWTILHMYATEQLERETDSMREDINYIGIINI